MRKTRFSKIGRYEIQQELGRGGMGVVYKAYDPAIERTVALKTINFQAFTPPSRIKELMSRQKSEVKIAGKLSHPNIVAIHDVVEEEGVFAIVMEYVEGETLNRLLEKEQLMLLEETIEMMRKICNALEYAHAQGVIHRDIKPGNIIVTKDGVPKLMDFGIAQLAEATTITQTGESPGTPCYMSPEMIKGEKIDHRADIFALGCVLYEMLMGEKAFPGKYVNAVMYKVLEEEPLSPADLRKDLPPECDSIIFRALAKCSDKRYQTALEFADDLVTLVERAKVMPTKRKKRAIRKVVAKRKKEIEIPTKILINRKEEKKILEKFLSEDKKRVRSAMITGNVGIGKTRLVKEVLANLQSTEILWSDCLALFEGMPYYSVREIIKSKMRRYGEGIVKEIPLAYRIEIGKLIPEIADVVKDGQDKVGLVIDKYRLYESVKRVIEIGGLRKIIVLDNMQWVDNETLEVFKYLLRASSDKNVLFLFIHRKEEATEALDDFTTLVGREIDIIKMELQLLCDNDIREMVAVIIGTKPMDELVGYIKQGSGGNPLYVEEIIRVLSETGYLKVVGRRWRFEEPKEEIVPTKLGDIIERKYRTLNEEGKEVLEVASVIGGFDIDLIRDITGYDAARVIEEIDNIGRLGLIKERGNSIEFKESISHNAIYCKNVAGIKRKMLHKKIGEILEEKYKGKEQEVIEELAFHFCKAKDKDKAVRYCIESGDRAKEKYANDSAVKYYGSALEYLPDSKVEEKEIKMVECLRKRAETLNLIGANEEAIKAIDKGIDLSKDIDDKKLIAGCLVRLGKIYGSIGRYVEELNFAKEALLLYKKNKDEKGIASSLNTIGGAFSDLGDYEKALESFRKSLKIREEIGDRRGQAMNFGGLGQVCAYLAQYEKAFVYFNKALKISEEIGDRNGQSANLNNIGFVHSHLGDHEKALRYYSKALKINEEIGDRADQATGLNNIGVQHHYLGDQEKRLEYYNKALKISEEIGDRGGQAGKLSNIGLAHIDLGDYEKAFKYLNKSLKICKEIGDRRGQAMNFGGLGQVCTYFGQYEKAFVYFKESLKICKERGYRRGQAVNLQQMGKIYIELNDFKKAKECLISAEKIAKDIRNKNVLLITAVSFAELELKKNNTEKSAVHIKKAERLAEELKSKLGKTMTLLLYARVNTINRRWQNANKNFREAIKMYEELKLPFELAKAYIHYNNFLKIKGETQKAKEYLKKAEGIFKKLGANGWIKKVKQIEKDT